MWMLKENSKIFLLFFLFVPLGLFSQELNEAKAKVAYIQQFTEYLTWPDEASMNTFRIAIFNDAGDIVKELEELQLNIDIKSKPIELVTYDAPNDIAEPQIIFVNKERISELNQILEHVNNRPILVISDMAFNLSNSMINFIERDEKLGFEVDAERISSCKILIDPKLLFLSGEKVDLRKLYLESEKSLAEERERVEKQKQMLEKQAKEMLFQKQQIGLQKISIAEQTERLRKQKDSLSKQEDQIDEQRYELGKLIWAIKQKEKILAEKTDLLEQQEKNIDKQRKKVAEYNKVLDKQKEEIIQHQVQIEKQLSVLSQKEAEIKQQRVILYLGGAGFLLFIILMSVIWISYREKKRANAMLEEKNTAIKHQNQEIARQRDETERQRSLLASQHEQITSSIRYATTIQLAMLPRPYEFEEFDHFIMYKAKDMVSGDFYWMRTFEDNNITYHMIAVVDCTGHGVPGAFMSMIANRLLNEIVTIKQIIEPALVLDYLDRYVQGSLRQEITENRDGMDVSLVRISEKKNGFRNLIFAGAKRPLIYFDATQNAILRQKGSRRGIGGPKGNSKLEPFDTIKMVLRSGDSVYLTSDGYIDQNNVLRKRFGSQRLNDLLLKISKDDMSTQHKKLEEAMQNYQGEADQRDDITIVGLRM